jgi:hypothetical protein
MFHDRIGNGITLIQRLILTMMTLHQIQGFVVSVAQLEHSNCPHPLSVQSSRVWSTLDTSVC